MYGVKINSFAAPCAALCLGMVMIVALICLLSGCERNVAESSRITAVAVGELYTEVYGEADSQIEDAARAGDVERLRWLTREVTPPLNLAKDILALNARAVVIYSQVQDGTPISQIDVAELGRSASALLGDTIVIDTVADLSALSDRLLTYAQSLIVGVQQSLTPATSSLPASSITLNQPDPVARLPTASSNSTGPVYRGNANATATNGGRNGYIRISTH